MASHYPNTFSVAVYACCREIYSAKRHTGYVGGTEKEAKAYYMMVLTNEFEALEVEDAATKERAQKFVVDQKAEKLSQMHAQEDEKQEVLEESKD